MSEHVQGTQAAAEQTVAAGTGEAAFDFGTATGTVRAIATPKDVVGLLRDGSAGQVVALIDDCGATLLAPILPSLTGVICTVGNRETHLGIVAREYQLPCVFDKSAAELADGATVRMWSAGVQGGFELMETAR